MLPKSQLKRLMARYNFRPKKRWGQNFLVDSNILKKIIDSADLSKRDIILEIGAGLGALTEELAKRAKRVFVVEKDLSLIRILQEVLARSRYRNVEVTGGDILKFDITKVVRQNGRIKVIGNLPYYITTPIIFYLLGKRSIIDFILITVQKEVARRLVAPPGTKDYGAISCFIQFYTEPFIIADIKKVAFFPCPEVDSSLIRLNILKKSPVYVEDEDLFFKIIRSSFSQRRKMLLNSLGDLGGFSLDKESLLQVLKEVGIDPRTRGEALSLEEFARIANRLKTS